MPGTPEQTAAYLRGLNTSDRVRAAAFDAIHNAVDENDAIERMRALPFSDEIRAELWDLRSGQTVASREQGMVTPESTAPEGSAIGRFASGVGEMLNPIAMAQGISQAVRHPIDTVTGLAQAQGEQFSKARDALGEGRYSEAVGHGVASALPIVGPAAANIGEQIGEGDVAGGLGRATGLMAPVAAARPVARGVGRQLRPAATKLQTAAEKRVVQALGPTKEHFKAIAQKRAPEILRRRMGGSRETLQAQAGQMVETVGQQIDDAIQQFGSRQVGVEPILQALEESKQAFQTMKPMPLAEAVRTGAVKSPGARVVGEVVEVPVVFEPRAVRQLSQLQRVIERLGPEARVDQLVAVRRAWDDIVADAGGYAHRAPGGIGKPLRDISEASTKREATGAIRSLLSKEVPELATINKEFAFWKDIDDVLTQTLQRTQPHGKGVGRIAAEGAGQVVGGLAGSAYGTGGTIGGAILVGKLAEMARAAFTSPRWRLVDARLRSRLADAIASGDTERIGQTLGRVTAVTGAGRVATTPTVPQTATQ